MRSRLDAQLEQLHTALIEMGALIEYAISSAADALFGQDVALKMITDMERIGDQSADIAEIVSHLAGAPYITDLSALRRMAEAACGMVKRSVDAFVQRDLALAQAVVADDDFVDAQFCAVRRTLVELLRRDASCGEQALDLLMVAKYLERIGDHAVNIAEWVIYSITGVHKNEELVDHI